MRTIQPPELASDQPLTPGSCRGRDVWATFCAAADGDVAGLRALVARDPRLALAEYWYTPPLHFAAREGRLDAARVLLEAGADPAFVTLGGDDLATIARERGHEDVARLLEAARGKGRPDQAPGGTPLHRAVAEGARDEVKRLLDAGADVHALHGGGPGSEDGYAPRAFQPIDLALWTGPHFGVRGDLLTARLLLAHGASFDLTVAAALGELDRVRALLDAEPARISETRPSGKRPLSTAVEFSHPAIVTLLLERGADPTWPESALASRGLALHAAARAGERALVELLLDHGADPNAGLDSSGSATYAARTPELRRLLLARGGRLDCHDLVWLGEDDEAVRRVAADPSAADAGCGGALAAACKEGRRELVVRLLDAGARVPPVLTACRSYLLGDPELLKLLLASGMSPDLPDWQRATPLHDLCGLDSRGRPRPQRLACAAVLLDAGASLTVRDEDYRSTPLAWAARTGLADMAELLLRRGSPTRLSDDEPWATPLAWATRRGRAEIVALLREAGATE